MPNTLSLKTVGFINLPHRQKGVSLIELMVGILIGLLVVIAALLTMLAARTSSLTVSDATQLEQQANLAMDVIGQQIKQAGAMNLIPSFSGGTHANSVEFEDFAALNGVDFNTRKIIVEGRDGADNAPDTLTITYSAPKHDGMSQNCAGNGPVSYPAAADSPALVSSQVVSTITVNANGNLTCGVAGATESLASNVRDFQVRYITNNGAVGSTRTASDVTDWAGIDGVEICLHFTGNSTQAAPAGTAPTFRDCSGNVINADGRLHRIARNVFRLRNSASL